MATYPHPNPTGKQLYTGTRSSLHTVCVKTIRTLSPVKSPILQNCPSKLRENLRQSQTNKRFMYHGSELIVASAHRGANTEACCHCCSTPCHCCKSLYLQLKQHLGDLQGPMPSDCSFSLFFGNQTLKTRTFKSIVFTGERRKSLNRLRERHRFIKDLRRP